MRKNFFKKALAVMGVTTLLLGMSANVYAADDEVKFDGIAGEKVIDQGYVPMYGAEGLTGITDSAYKYLSVTYKGDEGALATVRIEFKNAGTSAFRWFRDNTAGVLVQADGTQAPAATNEYQTVIFDLSKSDITITDLQTVYFHAGDAAYTAAKAIEFKDVKLMKALPSSGSTETTTAASEETTTSAAGSEATTAAAGSEATTGAGSAGTGAPTTGDSSVATAMIVTLVAGAAVVAVASRKKANAAE